MELASCGPYRNCPTRVGMNRRRPNQPPLSISNCPTRVGMNRTVPCSAYQSLKLPHTRGDEPNLGREGAEITEICPTRVGMNRRSWPAPRSAPIVCPTRVGMNRRKTAKHYIRNRSAPHAWG